MSNFNRVILAGNMTRDPELRYTQGGTSICKFGLAVNRKFSDGKGGAKETTAFIDMVAFGKQAEVIAEHMTKGRPILVEGRLEYSSWQRDDGSKASKLEVVVEQFQFIGSRPEGSAETGTRKGPAKAKAEPKDDGPDYGEIPF